MCVCALRLGHLQRFLELAISGSLQSPPPYVNKHDRSCCLYQRWEEGEAHRGVCACVAGLAGAVCGRELLGAREGQAQPCHACRQL